MTTFQEKKKSDKSTPQGCQLRRERKEHKHKGLTQNRTIAVYLIVNYLRDLR